MKGEELRQKTRKKHHKWPKIDKPSFLLFVLHKTMQKSLLKITMKNKYFFWVFSCNIKENMVYLSGLMCDEARGCHESG